MTPQLENGFTRIANELMDVLARFRIPGTEMRVLFAILRLTYGYRRKEAKIKGKTIAEITLLDKTNVSHALSRLGEMKIVVKDHNFLKLNKDWSTWISLEKLCTTTTQKSCEGPQQKVVKDHNLHIYKEKKENKEGSSFLASTPENQKKEEAFKKLTWIDQTQENFDCFCSLSKDDRILVCKKAEDIRDGKLIFKLFE